MRSCPANSRTAGSAKGALCPRALAPRHPSRPSWTLLDLALSMQQRGDIAPGSTAFSYAIVKRDSRLIIELDAPIPRILGRSPRFIRSSGGGCACVFDRAACLVWDVRGRWNCGACCGRCTNGTPDAPTTIHHAGPEAGEVYARGRRPGHRTCSLSDPARGAQRGRPLRQRERPGGRA